MVRFHDYRFIEVSEFQAWLQLLSENNGPVIDQWARSGRTAHFWLNEEVSAELKYYPVDLINGDYYFAHHSDYSHVRIDLVNSSYSLFGKGCRSVEIYTQVREIISLLTDEMPE